MPIIRPPLLLSLDATFCGTIEKRPSAKIKSPYVADIVVDGQPEALLAHTPSLGCCGLCEKGSPVIMTKLDKKQKCDYRVCFSVCGKTIVCIYPKLAENVVEKAIQKNYISSLKNVQKYTREVTMEMEGRPNCRFDFSGTDENGCLFLLEVKAVPLATSDHISYFPDGYRKKPTDLVSPRAFKHVQELEIIKQEYGEKIRCIMCYVVQRSDTHSFQLGEKDPEYKKAVYSAMENGVEVLVLQIHWTKDGRAYFAKDQLPFIKS